MKRKHSPPASSKLEPFEFDPQRDARTMSRIFGAVLLVAALVPTVITAAQWLTFDGRGPPPQTGASSIIPGALLALWGVQLVTARARLRADPASRTLTWSRRTLGIWHVSKRWTWSDVQALVARPNSRTDRALGYTAVALGPRGEREVCGWSDTPEPWEVRQLSALLGVPFNLEP